MSFDNSQMSYTHLVSFPSCWLPPKNTLKILIVGFEQPELETLCADVQVRYPNLNLAIYFVPELNWNNIEHLDWLLTNQHHTSGTFVQITDWCSLAAAGTLDNVFAHCQSSLPEIHKLVENSKITQMSFFNFIDTICGQEDR
jgi:hypothetical protein